MWKRTSREKYRDAPEVLPPAYQDGVGFLLGEPVVHRMCKVTGDIRPTYEACIEHKGRYYVSKQAITIAEYKWAITHSPRFSRGGGR